MTFSERVGLSPDRTFAQTESIDDDLRTALWNAMHALVYQNRGQTALALRDTIWTEYLKESRHVLDQFLSSQGRLVHEGRKVGDFFLHSPWNRVYDLLETVSAHHFIEQLDERAQTSEAEPIFFADRVNGLLERHNAGYRLVTSRIIPITQPVEIAEIEEAIAAVEGRPGAGRALAKALELFADRRGEHHTNVVSESINAVESIARQVAADLGAKGQDTLGKSLVFLRPHVPESRRPLLDGWGQVFGFTSQTVRHGGPKDPEVSAAEAQFFLVTASAFINLLLDYGANTTKTGADT